DDVKITATPVTDGITMLQGQGGNIGLFSGPEATFLVDDQFAPLTDKILAAVTAAGGGRPDFVLNTHYHGDHTGGNENLGATGTVVVAHRHVRDRMSIAKTILGGDVPASPEAALPVVTFDETMTFHLNGHTVEAKHFPNAHTDGDAILHFTEANVVHMGDLYFQGTFPFVDTDGGGSLLGLIEAIEAILPMCDGDTKVIPGHGVLSNRAELEDYLTMLKGVRDAVLPLVQDGKSMEEITEANPLEPFLEKWGGSRFMTPERFLPIMVQTLQDRATR
ncbi:MAG: MBL fold metallo-hydrolase, partial [Candidatus Eisenbacteria bacterium]|nr:MBL fold metallo-hydrolase [Candidatus Eisenbacteria bacterium]